MKLLKSLSLCGAALLLFSLSACSPKLTQRVYLVDYVEAGQGKVFISESNSVSFDYEPLSSIIVEEFPGIVKTVVPVSGKESGRGGDPIYGDNKDAKVIQNYQKATAQSALNYAARKVIEMGGDGLINLKMSTFVEGGKNAVQISGMVIKRNDK